MEYGDQCPVDKKFEFFSQVQSSLCKLTDKNWSLLCTTAVLFSFFAPITDTGFPAVWRMLADLLMMCWKAVKWKKEVTNLWWQKQQGDSVT